MRKIHSTGTLISFSYYDVEEKCQIRLNQATCTSVWCNKFHDDLQDNHYTVHPFQRITYFCLQIFELRPELKEFGGCEEYGAEGLNHEGSKLEILLQEEDL